MQQPMFSGTPALFFIGCHSYVDWMVVLVIIGAAAMNMRGCVYPKKTSMILGEQYNSDYSL